jgi:PAS domain S-box-containing protein
MRDRPVIGEDTPFDRLARYLPDFVLQTDPSGVILYLNRTDGVLERDAYLHSSVFDWVAIENREALQETLDHCLRTNQGSEIEYRFLSPNGEETWHSARITPLVVGEKVDCLLLVVRDITERRRFEQETKQRNRELAALLSVSQQLTGRLDLQGLMQIVVDAIVKVLPAAERSSLWLFDDKEAKLVVHAWAGHPDESIEGLRLSPDTSLVGLVFRTAQAYVVGDTHHDESFLMLGRPPLDAVRSVLGVPLLVEGQPIGALFADNFSRQSAFSASDRRMLESLASQAAIAIDNARLYQALQESQRQSATLMGNLPGMAYRCKNDRDWTMEFVSDGCIGLTGYSSEELVGNRRVSYGDLIDPEDRAMVWGSVQEAVGADMPFRIEYRINTNDAGQKWVWEQGQGVKDPHGNVIALEGFITDTTDRRLAEIGLEQHSQQLDHSHRLVTSLSRVATRLQTNLDAKDILRTLGEELAKFGLNCLVGSVEDRSGETEIAYESISRAPAEQVERLTGTAAIGMRFPARQLPALNTAIQEGSPVFLSRLTSEVTELFPGVSTQSPEGTRPQTDRTEVGSAILIPMPESGSIKRVLAIWGPRLRKSDQRIFSIFASQVSIALENARLFSLVREGRSRLQALAHRQVETQELERRRIARELHDEIGQILTGLKLTLEMSQALPAEEIPGNLMDARKMVDELLSKVRELSLDLRPSMLDDLGLLPALKWHFDRYNAQTGVKVNFQHGGIEGRRLGSELETAAYRIVQEALTNVARHACVDSVDIVIGVERGTMRIQIDDTGVGFDIEHAYSSGTSGGLSGMRERAVALGGQVLLQSQPGAGTHLEVMMPLSGRLERRGEDRIRR